MGLLDDDYGIKGKLRALRDTAQSASNAIASNISGPVDLISMGLRGVGLPIPEDAIGGSKWMADRGLTKEVPMGAPRIIGETLGMAGPAVAAAKAQHIASGLNQMQANAMAPNVLRKQSGMFIGPSAKTWDAEAAKQAQTMAARGADPRKIWSETGTWKGPDGKWRQEIPDNLASYDPEALADLKSMDSFDYLKDTQPLGGVVGHGQVYKAYPDMQDIPVHFMPQSKMGDAYGSYAQNLDRLTLSDSASGMDKTSAALHEMQHAIQKREGMSGGGSPKQFASDISALNELNNMGFSEMDDFQRIMFKDLREKYGKSRSPNEVYQRLAGEAEARATQARIPLTAAQRRAKFPLDSYDVPIESLIVRGAQ